MFRKHILCMFGLRYPFALVAVACFLSGDSLLSETRYRAIPGDTIHRHVDARPALTTLMYLVNNPAALASFREHADEVSIIAPQCFSMDADGFVAGEVPAEVLEVARQHHVAVMPLVTNRGFKQESMHKVLDDAEARQRAIRYLLYYALRDGYIGVQFDYENIRYTYRAKFTAFFQQAARAFHRHGLLLTAAVVGRYSDDRNASSPGGFDNWSGVYDYRELGASADFLSIMAYPEHAGFSEPGPLAGVPWVRQIADYTAQRMPRRKISLGIPLYGERWIALPEGQAANPAAFIQDNAGTANKRWKARGIGFSAIATLSAGVKPVWDKNDQAYNLSFVKEGARNEVWYEDARSLAPKLQLVIAEGFDGISAWVLGMEDPRFWDVIGESYRVRHPRSRLRAGSLAERAQAAARAMRR